MSASRGLLIQPVPARTGAQLTPQIPQMPQMPQEPVFPIRSPMPSAPTVQSHTLRALRCRISQAVLLLGLQLGTIFRFLTTLTLLPGLPSITTNGAAGSTPIGMAENTGSLLITNALSQRAANASPEPALPPGWNAYLDIHQQYYVHESTATFQWELPRGVANSNASYRFAQRHG
ncbi:hypothetical protein FSARC_8582 [Fusarium sarcochroum]|uniref:WW domain-containing protein n=1 Tax=Fusarium sarcochroum TaxID=1208366 RepID=A0A8H4X6U4_9HYPO|nr:hypothetical protein FSARC_8582 [Fusarium sarcochroum]